MLARALLAESGGAFRLFWIHFFSLRSVLHLGVTVPEAGTLEWSVCLRGDAGVSASTPPPESTESPPSITSAVLCTEKDLSLPSQRKQ